MDEGAKLSVLPAHIQIFHASEYIHCNGLNEDEIKITRTQVRNLKILCNKCTTNMDKFGLILESINGLREELDININTQIRALREEFNAKIDAISTGNDQIAELSTPENLENVVVEVSEHQNRAKNIIVFIIKDPTGSPEACQASDNSDKQAIMNEIVTDNSVNIVECSRVGKKAI
ncbi:hypothetical protein HHI36_003907 [Cryptolaemus montrouzieri]|uniref:Uncharacterized protein n=1 Tax=Cryptolaemus montrouzieri TaxID=559131 RepID=A0ABD2NR85_9CUCU